MFPAALVVSVVNVATDGVALMANTPLTSFVKAVTAWVPFIFQLRLLVIVAEVMAPAPVEVIFPLFVKVGTEQVPLRFKVPVTLFVKDPVPDPVRLVPTVNVPLLVTATPVLTETVDIAIVPPNVAAVVFIVAVPVKVTVPAVFVIPAAKTTVALAPVNVPPFNVTKPVKVLLPALTGSVIVPVVIVVVPLTVDAKAPVVVRFPPFKDKLRPTDKVKAPVVNVPPLRSKSLVIDRSAPCVTVAVPLKVKSLLTVVTAHVLTPLPDKVRLL